MKLSHLVIVTILAGLMAWGVKEARDPRRTALPLNADDLASIQPKLEKLPKEDRDLVVGYLKRSRGDVLPAASADPSAPLTARTFAEAIELQRRFLAQAARQESQARARAAERDQALAPLRSALAIRLIKREIVPRGQLLSSPAADAGRTIKRAIDDRPVLVTIYRLENTSGEDIESAQASVAVRKTRREPNEPGLLHDCHIDHPARIPAGASVEVRCGHTGRQASADDQAYVAMPESDFVVEWVPTSIRFASGKTLRFTD